MYCLYAPDLFSQEEYTFNEAESHHLANVLRASVGTTIRITNGKGMLFMAEIIFVHKKNCRVKIISRESFQRKAGNIHLFIAPVKTNERLGFLLEKLTELGVTSITPVLTQNCERRVFNHEKELAHLIAAIKQSQHPFLPELHPLIKFEQILTSVHMHVAQKLLCHCRETPKTMLSQTYQKGQDVVLFLGPEGDFLREEVQFAETNGFVSVSLGSEVLRAETAAIAATIAVKTLNQLI